MKKILMVSENKEHVQSVRSCFLEGNTFDQTGDVNTALEMLRKERRDFIFLDIGKLKDAIKNGQSYEEEGCRTVRHRNLP